ncbi:MAG: PAS domain S-box protein [Chlorobiaceae bacterium]|nr:PAS domain S-box protein [Chlorobiaceae bacterium]
MISKELGKQTLDAAIQSSELRYRRLFECAQDGILILDFKSGKIVDANPYIINLLGFTLSDIIDKELWEIGFIVDQERTKQAYQELRLSNYIRYEDLPLQHKQGHIIPVEFVCNVYDVGLEKVIQCNIRDVSDKQRLAETLAKSELQYRKLFENAQNGIMILDYKNGKIVDTNPFILNLLGFSAPELVGKELWEIGFMLDKEVALQAFDELKEKNYLRYENLPLRKKYGQSIDVEFISNVYEVSDKKVIQCDIRDISSKRVIAQYKNVLALSMDDLVNALVAMVETRDPYTAGHQERVSELAEAIAIELNYQQINMDGLRMSAMLHDIGKYTIPAEILTKPRTLNDIEIAMLRTHAYESFKILKLIHFPWPVAQTVLQHHERLDGSGYPNGLKGDSICDEARIIAVADTVEALTSPRPYRPAVGLDIALANILEASERLFDPQVVAICLRLFKEKKFQFTPQKGQKTYTVENVRGSL